MKTWKIVLPLWIILVVLVFVPVVLAEENNIQSIQIDVKLHEDGSGTIRETRQMETYEHTEIYIELENLQGSELLDFEVAGFTFEEDWDIDASFEEKAGKYGIIDTDDGYELAWGITEYGEPEYHVTYTLSNLVRELEDGQALFWNFDSFLNLPTDRMQLTLTAPYALEDVVLDYYGFGFEGPMELNEGSLEWLGFGLDESNDIIVLAQFPQNTFQTSLQEEMTLEEQRAMATEGSSYNEAEPMPTWAKVLIGGLLALGGGSAVGGAVIGTKVYNRKKEANHFYPMEIMKENRKKTTENPPRLDGDIGRYMAFVSNLSPEGGGFAEYFYAYLLLWSIEGRIEIETTEQERKIFGTKKKATLTIIDLEEEIAQNTLSFSEYVELFDLGEATLEEVMWAILLEAAEYRPILDEKAFEQWSEDNANEVAEFYERVEDVSKEWLVENGYIEQDSIKYLKMNLSLEKLTDKGQHVTNQIVQFDNFLKGIEESSLTDFDNWHELIVWAALLGRAEDTVEYLEEYHPAAWGFLLEEYPTLYGSYYGYHYFYMSHTSGLTSGGYGGAAGGMSSVGGGAGAAGGGGGGSR